MFFLSLLGAFMAFISSGSAVFSVQSLSSVAGLTAAFLPSLISAANTIKFVNHCPYDLYSWTVGPVDSDYTGKDYQVVTIPANSVIPHGMVNGEAIDGGIALKLRDLPRYEVAPAGIIQVEYHLEPSKNHLWYDLSAIDCNHVVGPEDPSFCPLVGSGIKVYVEHPDIEKCPPAWCGTNGCHNTYTRRGSWEGEPTFRCDAGTDIVVELCTEKAGPRTFDELTEPGHPAEPDQGTKLGETTTSGVCGAQAPGGATCFGYTHGNCCSSYGWCGFSEVHCGEGCQSGFGDCFSSGPSYQSPAKPSSIESTHAKPAFSYHPPASTYDQLPQTHIEHTQATPISSTPAPSYAELSSSRLTQVYSAPTPSYVKPTGSHSYYPPVSSHVNPTPSHSESAPAYSTPPTYTPENSPAYSPPPYHTVYTTQTVTETLPQATETVTVRVSSWYNVSTVYDPPIAVNCTPSHTHTSQQEPVIPSAWYEERSGSDG